MKKKNHPVILTDQEILLMCDIYQNKVCKCVDQMEKDLPEIPVDMKMGWENIQSKIAALNKKRK